MSHRYVELQDHEHVLTGSRVTLASLIACWKDGLSPESIRDEFQTLSLEQVYGAITFYLHNQSTIEANASGRSSEFFHRSQQAANLNPGITLKLRSALPPAK